MKRSAVLLVAVTMLVLVSCSGGARTIPGTRTGKSVASVPQSVVQSTAVTFPSMIHAENPLAGSGGGGAFGPMKTAFLISLPALPLPHLMPVPDRSAIDLRASLEYAPNVIEGGLSTYHFGESGTPGTPAPVATSSARPIQSVTRPMSIAPSSTFVTAGDQDLGAATSGTYILQTRASGTFSIYTMGGGNVQTLAYTQLYCGSQPLPICSSNYNPGPGDNRVIYDAGAQRWVISSLWVNAGGPLTVPVASLAVSKTSDPTGSWYVYQFPNCGTSDQTIGDQPRLGFNNQWIVVTSSCSLASDPSLNVFDKANLYAGGALSLNANWFGFADSSNVSNKDNPARTYTSTINNREYLSFLRLDTNTNKEQVVYSHVEGSTDSPVFYSETDAVDTQVPWTNGGGVTTLDAPGCTGCVGGETNGTIHSSDVYQLSNGQQYILSTNVEADATYANADDVLAVAISDSGVAETVAIMPSSSGEGGIASEIGMPSVQNIADTASIVFDYSSSTFYPGIYAAQWNIDQNRLDFNQPIQQGNVVPPGCSPPSNCTATRIADYIDAFAPIPGSSQFLAAGDVLNSGAANDREIYWMNLAIAPPCTADSYGYCSIFMSRSLNSQCDTGYKNVHGAPIIIYAYNTTYDIFNQSGLIETATEYQSVPSNKPCTMTTRWSPNEPKVQYGDPNLP